MWSRPSRCRIVACRSWTCRRSSTAWRPSSSVAPMVWPPLHAAAGHPHGEARTGCDRGRRPFRSSACGRTRRPRRPASRRAGRGVSGRAAGRRSAGPSPRHSSRVVLFDAACARPTCCPRRDRAARTARRVRPAAGRAGRCGRTMAVVGLVHAVQLLRLCRFVGQIDRLRRVGLHAEGEFVAADAGVELRSARGAFRRCRRFSSFSKSSLARWRDSSDALGRATGSGSAPGRLKSACPDKSPGMNPAPQFRGPLTTLPGLSSITTNAGRFSFSVPRP